MALRIAIPVFAATSLLTLAGVLPADEPKLPLVFQDDFEHGAKHWSPTDPAAWKIQKTDRGHVFSQFQKSSKYKPPHRSPLNFALVKDVFVGDFVLQAKARSTVPDYGHRDLCLFFGFQDKAHFYYVHLGKKTDDHANQIFIVDGKDRAKISTKTTPGTDWDDNWHTLRVERNVSSGDIKVFYDDLKTPVMTAADKRFTWGQIGIGTFDDTGDWDDVTLHGVQVDKPGR